MHGRPEFLLKRPVRHKGLTIPAPHLASDMNSLSIPEEQHFHSIASATALKQMCFKLP